MTKAVNKPFYVVAESFKFVRLYPLNQQDVPNHYKVINFYKLLFLGKVRQWYPSLVLVRFLCQSFFEKCYQNSCYPRTHVEGTSCPFHSTHWVTEHWGVFFQYSKNTEDGGHPLVDYTPPSYITLLFTDLGVLTPSAVSDELIKLYLWQARVGLKETAVTRVDLKDRLLRTKGHGSSEHEKCTGQRFLYSY